MRPADVAELQAAILEANARGRTLELRGGGSKAPIGGPDAADEILDLTAFAGVIDYDPAELVLTAGPGTPLAEIERLLDDNGQMLAFEPIDHAPMLGVTATATLGGVIAANASGPRRVSAGAARDHFLGFTAVSGRGEVFKGGGKVVKNVTGYDLPKLLAGSWGTLAALTEVTVKVLPRPRAAATLVLRGLTDQAAAEAMSVALGSAAPVTAAAHLPASGATLLRIEGVEPSIRTGLDVLAGLLGPSSEEMDAQETARVWADVRDVSPFAGDARPVWRVSTAPAGGWRLRGELGTAAEVVYDWGGGLVWLAVEDPAADVRAAVARIGGHATLVWAPAGMRARVAAFQPEAPGLAALSARVKAAFDPNAVLGPRHRLAG